MVFAKAVYIETDSLGELDFGDHVAQPFPVRDALAGVRVAVSLRKTGEAEFEVPQGRRP